MARKFVMTIAYRPDPIVRVDRTQLAGSVHHLLNASLIETGPKTVCLMHDADVHKSVQGGG
jgi:hypothetical protein